MLFKIKLFFFFLFILIDKQSSSFRDIARKVRFCSFVISVFVVYTDLSFAPRFDAFIRHCVVINENWRETTRYNACKFSGSKLTGEISGENRRRSFLSSRDKLERIDTNEKIIQIISSHGTTSCFVPCSKSYFHLGVHIHTHTGRATVNSAKRHKSHMTLPSSCNESLPRRGEDQPRTSKLQNDRCFISISPSN